MTKEEALTLEALKYAASLGDGRIVREMKIPPFIIRCDEALAQPVQRPWVGLTEVDILAASKHWRHAEDFMAGVYWAAGTLKEFNTCQE